MANKVVAVTLTARTAAYVTQMAAAAKATAGVGTAAGTAAVAAQPLDRSLRNTARATGILNPKLIGPAGLVFGLKSVVGQAKDFEDQFAMVRKTMQESDDVLDQVALNIREIATELPVTTRELNEIATVAGQLGIAAEDVSGFTETMAKLSIATNLTAEGAAIDFARLSNIMGKPIAEVEELGNVIVHLGNNMAAQETEIMEFAKRIAGVGTQMGMAEHEIMALSAALPALGLRAEMGGTAITRIMVEVNAAVTEGTEKLGIFAQTAGMSAEGFAEAWRADPAQTLMDFTAGIGRLSDEGVDAFETIADLDLSMIRTQDTALRLAGGTEVYANAMSLANSEMDDQVALQTEIDKRLRTTESQWKILKNNVKEFALEVGGPLNEALGEMLRLMNELSQSDRGFWGSFVDGATLRNVGPGDSNPAAFWQELFGTEDIRDDPDRMGMGAYLSALGDAMALWFTGDITDFEAPRPERFQAALEQPFGLADYEEDFLRLNGQLGGTQRAAEGASEAISAMEASLEAAAKGAEIAAEGLANYIDQKQRAVDPVYNLMSALDDVEAAQKNYNDTQNDSEATQRDVENAAVDLHRALETLESAAIDGDLSFAEFDRRLDHWVATGRLTATQADLIRERVKGAREEGERYDGEYVANMIAHTETAEERLRRVANLIASIPSRIATSVFVDSSAYNAAMGRVQTGQPIHTGGYIHPDGSLQRFHSGGMVGAGLKRDEVPAILQTGEMVLSRGQVREMGAAFSSARESMARGGDGSSLVGTVNIHTTDPQQAADEMRHQLRIRQLQGAY